MDDDISIADEHYFQMMWEYGDPLIMENEPFCDTPDFGGWRAYLLRHEHDTPEQRSMNKTILEHSGHLHRLKFSFKCKFCNQGITFINHKPFDVLGKHRCLAEGRGKGQFYPRREPNVVTQQSLALDKDDHQDDYIDFIRDGASL
jgi:hypothetical protein